MDNYVLGFVFTKDMSSVLLQKKKYGPSINHDKWNGIGGKIEDWEVSSESINRESKEECHLTLYWNSFGTISNPEFEIDMFKAMLPSYIPLSDIPQTNDIGENQSFRKISDLLNHPETLAENVPTILTHALYGKGWLDIYV